MGQIECARLVVCSRSLRSNSNCNRKGNLGETYNIGGNNEIPNIEIVETICDLLDQKLPLKVEEYRDQIIYVDDRPVMISDTPLTQLRLNQNWVGGQRKF